MNDFLEVLLFVVPISTLIGGGYYLVRRKFRGLQLELAEERGANQTARIATEKSALEERVRVLEAIVTDRGFDVASQIEALRDRSDQPFNDAGVPLNLQTKEKA